MTSSVAGFLTSKVSMASTASPFTLFVKVCMCVLLPVLRPRNWAACDACRTWR